MPLTIGEENWVKEQYAEHEKWLAARKLDSTRLTSDEYKIELEKIYGEGFCDET